MGANNPDNAITRKVGIAYPTHQIDAIIAALSLPVGRPRLEVWMGLPFHIFKVQGDGNLHFVKAVPSLDAAKALVQSLAELWPGEYVIHNEETGERVSITAGGDPH